VGGVRGVVWAWWGGQRRVQFGRHSGEAPSRAVLTRLPVFLVAFASLAHGA
jgi:hypothetical protein